MAMGATTDIRSWPPEITALVAPGEDPARWAIGGRRPEAVLAPDSIACAAAALRWAGRAGLGVAPLGGGTGRGQLAAPARPYVALLTRGLAGVVEHTAPDLTVVVRAGTTLAALGAELEASGQRLPVDVPAPDRATVGGLVAANRSGPLRLGHGTVRDYLLGIAVLDGDGNLVRAGGRVVKNVAGYDLMKLHAGARGTLGLIVEACFKVQPLPDEVACVVGWTSPEGAERVRSGLRQARVPAVALELVSPAEPSAARVGEPGCQLVVGLEGVTAEIEWQVEVAAQVLAAGGAGPVTNLRGAAASDLLRSLAEFGGPAGPEDLRLRAAVLPSRTPELWQALSAAAPSARLEASAGSGIIRLGWPDPHPPGAPAAFVRDIRSLAAALGGHVIIDSLPEAWEGEADRFGQEPDPLTRGLKAALDPRGLYLPGAYFGLGAGPDADRALGSPAATRIPRP
jgi:glycolate oxidase FAD binding subunit